MSKNPNIILVLADDLGIGDVNCFNPDSKIPTPNIDRLAEQGMRMTDCHASSAVCTPSRYALLTGRYNWRSRLKRTVLPGQAPALIENGRETIGSMLQKQGYQTACVGKWHLGMDWVTNGDYQLPETYESVQWDRVLDGIDYSQPVKNGPTTRGFDYYYGMPASLDQPPFVRMENDQVLVVPDHTVGVIEFKHCEPEMCTALEYGPAEPGFDASKVVPDFDNKVLDLVDQYAEGEKPFFIYYATPAVHGPLLPEPAYAGKSEIGPYGDFVMQLDGFMGRLSEKLDQKGIADDTIVIFTSDNGCSTIVDFLRLEEMGHFPSYVYRGTKGDIWDGGHRIPFVVRWPGKVEAGSTCEQTVCLVDMFATLAEVTGATYGDDAAEDSVSNLCLWNGSNQPLREATIHHSLFGNFGIRKGKWKLEFCPGSGSQNYPMNGVHTAGMPAFQLYDMDADVSERTNLVEEYPEVVEELTAIATDYVMNGRSTPGAPQENYPCEQWPELAWMKK